VVERSETSGHRFIALPTPEGSQSYMSFFFKAPGLQFRPDSLTSGWGVSMRYMEVGDERFVVRQVEVFHNGNVLRYCREHWCDEFGRLNGTLFSRKPKWRVFFPGAELIEPATFERVWRRAKKSPLWKEQLALSRAAEWGATPHWFRETTKA
jgi:hypothetical protein